MSIPVSVIVPIFNQGDYALRAIDSLCAQTYDNLQIIVVDDGSSDGSTKRVRQHFGAKITLLEQENAGPSAALNAGLRIAQGDIIALMGGDDIATQDRITHQVAILGTANWDVVFSKPELIDETGTPIRDEFYPVFFQPPRESSILRSLFFDDNYLCAPSATMRRSVIDTVGPFHEGLIQLQDYDYWLRAAGQGYRLGVFDHRIVAYRRHTGNLSAATRDPATRTEIPIILESVLQTARPSVLRLTFPEFTQPVTDPEAPLSLFEQSAVLLAHPRQEVKMCGLTKAIALAKDMQGTVAPARPHPFRYIYNAGNAIR
jgi:hypothetical protein